MPSRDKGKTEIYNDDTLKKMSEVRIGHKLTEEIKKKISKGMIETRKNLFWSTKKIIKEKIIKTIEIAEKHNAEFICFPELSFDEEFLNEMKAHKEIIIICGSFYDSNNFNTCYVIIEGKEYPVFKITPAPIVETPIMEGQGMVSGDQPVIFGESNGNFRFSVLICMDYYTERLGIFNTEYEDIIGVDLIFIPSYKDNSQRFQKCADSDCENYLTDFIKTCHAKETCFVFGRYHKDLKNILIEKGLREKDRYDYKIFQATGENLIIFELSREKLQTPIPIKSIPRFRLIKKLKYDEGDWK
ncbi:hypothetical protein LCGC14_0871600 [marine sediment metagenome]|uniref:CN hydrolase domain-containing protein n=1 Tax=marine sediment metagenome TaxID=412755 RepID=A0A0F9PQ48_9ZZZZ